MKWRERMRGMEYESKYESEKRAGKWNWKRCRETEYRATTGHVMERTKYRPDNWAQRKAPTKRNVIYFTICTIWKMNKTFIRLAIVVVIFRSLFRLCFHLRYVHFVYIFSQLVSFQKISLHFYFDFFFSFFYLMSTCVCVKANVLYCIRI